MTLHPPPVSILAKRDLNRPPVDSEARPDFVLTSGPERPEKHFTFSKRPQRVILAGCVLRSITLEGL